MTSHRFVLSSAFLIGIAGTAFAADMPVKSPVYTKAPAPQGLVAGGMLEGYLGLNYMSSSNNNDSSDRVGAIFGGNIYYSLPIASSMSVQMDAQGEWYTNAPEDGPRGAAALGGHLSYRDPQKGLFGIFGSLIASSDQIHHFRSGWLAGIEGQVYSGNNTYYLQAGLGNLKVDSDPEGFKNGWFVRGVHRHFATDDSMLQAELAFGRSQQYIDGDDWGQFYSWGLKSVRRLAAGSPLYGTLEYRGSYILTRDQGGDHFWDNTMIVGVMMPLGGVKSLKHNDRYGATLDMPMLPARAAARAERLD